MDLYLHHLSSTAFLTTVALLLTILSLVLKHLVFCGSCCKKLAYCFQYKLPSHSYPGYISHLGSNKTILKNLPVENIELSEIVIDPIKTLTVATSSSSQDTTRENKDN